MFSHAILKSYYEALPATIQQINEASHSILPVGDSSLPHHRINPGEHRPCSRPYSPPEAIAYNKPIGLQELQAEQDRELKNPSLISSRLIRHSQPPSTLRFLPGKSR